MIIRIKNLHMRTIIGINSWERVDKQAVIVNAELEFDGTMAFESDDIDQTLDYRTISKKIIEHVENSQYQLIEALAGNLLKIIMEEPRVKRARIEVDKPNAVRSADSTSVEVSALRGASEGTDGCIHCAGSYGTGRSGSGTAGGAEPHRAG